jgi:hypothetical protein
MISPAFSPSAAREAEALLGQSLSAADAALAGAVPILRHLLGPTDPALFSDRILAQTRAQIEDLARQLAPSGVVELAERLAGEPALLRHAHALALEAELAERLTERLGLDPVAPPLVQSTIASPDARASARAMQLLAAQARFGQWHRRGELPLGELPDDLLRLAHRAAPDAKRAEPGLVSGRIALLGDAAAGLDAAALELGQAGVALFVTALARGSGLARDTAILATVPSQAPRLALALLACGVSPEAVERQLIALHPGLAIPDGIDALPPERAAALLAGAR